MTAPAADPIDDMCAKLLLRVLPVDGGTAPWMNHWNLTGGDSALHAEAADALQRLRAERDTLAAIVRAADAMRRAVYKSPEETGDPLAHAYDSARAKWEGK